MQGTKGRKEGNRWFCGSSYIWLLLNTSGSPQFNQKQKGELVMPAVCRTCNGAGQINRGSDGRRIRCPSCLGAGEPRSRIYRSNTGMYSNPTPPVVGRRGIRLPKLNIGLGERTSPKVWRGRIVEGSRHPNTGYILASWVKVAVIWALLLAGALAVWMYV